MVSNNSYLFATMYLVLLQLKESNGSLIGCVRIFGVDMVPREDDTFERDSRFLLKKQSLSVIRPSLA